MKKRYIALGIGILLVGAMVLGVGVYFKYSVFKPVGLYQEESAAALPFMLLADGRMQNDLRLALGGETEPPATLPTPTQPVTQPPVPQMTAPVTVEPTQEPTEPPTTAPAQTEPVPLDWYDDVLFIGDSRTVGLRDYCRIGNADFFCTVGMTVFDYWDTWAGDEDFDSQTLDSLLSDRTYGKIIVALGLNEIGYPHDEVMKAYEEMLAFIQERQPDAYIVLQSVMTVGREKMQDAWYYSPEHIYALNEQIMDLADGEKIFYIDPNEEFADADHFLLSDMSGDGAHLYVNQYPRWVEWLNAALGRLGI